MEVLLQRAVGLGVGQDAHIDDNIHIAGAGVLGHLGRTSSDQITGRQPADEKHRFLPGAEAAGERDEHTLTGLGHATIIGGHCLRFGPYPGSLSEQRRSAVSLARQPPSRSSRETWTGGAGAMPSLP